MSSGTCGCQGYDLTQGHDYKTIMDLLSFAEFYIGSYSEDIQRQVIEIICSGVVNYGEHSQVSGGVCADVMQAPGMNIDPRAHKIPGQSMSGFTDQEDVACTKREVS